MGGGAVIFSIIRPRNYRRNSKFMLSNKEFTVKLLIPYPYLVELLIHGRMVTCLHLHGLDRSNLAIIQFVTITSKKFIFLNINKFQNQFWNRVMVFLNINFQSSTCESTRPTENPISTKLKGHKSVSGRATVTGPVTAPVWVEKSICLTSKSVDHLPVLLRRLETPTIIFQIGNW